MGSNGIMPWRAHANFLNSIEPLAKLRSGVAICEISKQQHNVRFANTEFCKRLYKF